MSTGRWRVRQCHGLARMARVTQEKMNRCHGCFAPHETRQLRSPACCVMWHNSSNRRNLSSGGTMLRPSSVALSGSLAHVQRSCANATLVLLLAAPILFGNRPPLHPIGKSAIAVVTAGRSGLIAPAIDGATLAVNVAAPLLLVDRPSCLPFVPVICAIEGVNWAGVHRGCHHNRGWPGTAPAPH